MSKPPFTSGPLDPIQELGRPVLIISQSGAVAPTVYSVLGMERIPLLGQAGFVPLMIPNTGVLAGYKAYGGEGVFPLTARGNSPTIQSNAFQLNSGTLLQCRPLLRVVGTLTAGLAVDDIDLSIFYPSANQHWALQNLSGIINAFRQYPLPADAAVGPAQGADMALPAAYPAVRDAFEMAFDAEFMVWGQQLPGFQFINHGSVTLAAGAAAMLGLNVQAIRYDLVPWQGDPAQNITHTYGAFSVQAPADAVAVPVSAFPPLARGNAPG